VPDTTASAPASSRDRVGGLGGREVRAPRERQQQVHGQRTAAPLTRGRDLVAQVVRPKDADRPESAGVRGRGRQLRRGQAAAHPGLHHRPLDSKPFE
jgi:hypothetical protein